LSYYIAVRRGCDVDNPATSPQSTTVEQRTKCQHENSRRALRVQQSHAQENPQQFRGYGPLCWGVSASDGPGPATKTIDNVDRVFWMYEARGVPDGPDDGTLAPGAVAASLPFAPELASSITTGRMLPEEVSSRMRNLPRLQGSVSDAAPRLAS